MVVQINEIPIAPTNPTLEDRLLQILKHGNRFHLKSRAELLAWLDGLPKDEFGYH